jgi:hypothetical protein
LASPKSECEGLLNEALPFAKKMLCTHGEFLPFGVVLQTSGEIVHVGASDGQEGPRSADLIRLLEAAFTERARLGIYRATAIAYDVRLSDLPGSKKSDAIAVRLDHRDSYSVIVLVPYELRSDQVIYGDSFAQHGSGTVFPP